MGIRETKALLALTLLSICICSIAGTASASLECYDCHGSKATQDMRPVDAAFRDMSSGGFRGNHRTHLAAPATGSGCQICHPGSGSYTSSHRDGQIELSSHLNGSIPVTTYKNSTSAWAQSAIPLLGSCSSVNCHFETSTPVWGSDAGLTGCSTCHTTPPSDGSHGKKHSLYYGAGTASCRKCHPDLLSESGPFAHATSAGRRNLDIRFVTTPNSGGSYIGGSDAYPGYLPAYSPARNGSCTDFYCHSNGSGGAPNIPLTWSDSRTTTCYTCHNGRTSDSTAEKCAEFGVWDSAKGFCTPDLTMSSNGHHRLVGPQWIRKYPCNYCHYATTDAAGEILDRTRHVNGEKNVVIHPEWNIGGRPAASYDNAGKVCDNIYCHSDGTVDPETVRPFAWTEPKTSCNTCHG